MKAADPPSILSKHADFLKILPNPKVKRDFQNFKVLSLSQEIENRINFVPKEVVSKSLAKSNCHNSPLISIKLAGSHLDLSVRTLFRWIAGRRIRYFQKGKLVRLYREDIESILSLPGRFALQDIEKKDFKSHYSFSEISRFFGASKKTVTRWAQNGDLRFKKVGSRNKVSIQDLNLFLNQFTTQPKPRHAILLM